MPRTEVDLSAFKAALEHKRVSEGLSARQLCRQVGLAESAYSRMMNGKSISLGNFMTLVNWLGQPIEQLMSVREQSPNTRTIIGNLLRSDPVYSGAWPAVMAVLDLSEVEALRASERHAKSLSSTSH